MKSIVKRFLSLALVLVMVLSCIPTMALAAEDSSATYVAENTTTGVYFANINDAITTAQAGQIVKVLADSAESVVYNNEGVILDLNGHDLSNVTVPAEVTLSAIDSATDDYEGSFGALSGTVEGQIAATVKTSGEVKSYVTVTENGSYSFHRYYAAIAAISLKPSQVALGYRAEFRGDEAVKNAVVGYGYELWLNDGAHKTYSRTDALEKSSLTLRLKNILAEGNDSLNALGSTATIGGNAFMTLNLNGQEITLSGTEQETTLRQVVESVNANVASYGEAQLEQVRAMCTTYAAWMEGWATEAIFGNGEGTEGGDGLKVEITVDVTAENNVLTQDATLSNEDISVTVPQGTVLENGTTQLVLTITEKASTDSNVSEEEGYTLLPLDVHIQGISADNTTPIIVCLGEVLPKGLNIGNYELYHVESGKTVEMTRVYFPAELDTHNEFYYSPATGTVTVALASFSEIALVANEENPWDGTADTTWYNEETTEFTLYNAQQLAGLGKLVDNGNTFDGKNIVLGFDINLYGKDENGERRSFNPIGYGYDVVFKGSFNGNGHTIRNLYQNGWALGLSYSTAGGGLFASVVDADFSNLTIDGAEVVMECIDMGTLVGYAYGTCSFTNIVVSNSVVANYNRYTGGVVGEVNGNHTFYNVDVADTTTLSALWGTFDPSVGGIIGGKYGDAKVHMEKCDVACKLDVFNDVTSAYQWYSYRRCGMLIGYTEETRTDNGRTTAKADFLTTKDCTVVYGDWAKYTYCEFNNTTSMDARYPWVRVEEGLYNGAYSNARYGNPIVNGEAITADNHTKDDHLEGDQHLMEATFHQLYGGGQGCYGGNWHVGQGVTEYVTYEDGKQPPKHVTKFTSKFNNGSAIISGTTLTLGQLFEAANVTSAIQNMDVHAYVSAVNEGDTVSATFNKVNDDWTKSTLTFTGEGAATITITDYYYCVPTTLKVTVKTGTVQASVSDKTVTASGYEFVGTTDSAGTLHISVGQCSPGWRYKVFYPDGTESIDYGPYTAGPEKSLHIESGTWKVVFYAHDSATDSHCEGTVSFNVTFAADDAGEVEKVPHDVSDTKLTVGDNTLTLLDTAVTTIFKFTPTETGVYTITAPDGIIIGNWGNNVGNLIDPNSTQSTCEWTCDGVGQSVYIGVSGVDGSFILNIIRTADIEVEEPEPDPEPSEPDPTDPSEPDPDPEPSEPSEPSGEVVSVSTYAEFSGAVAEAESVITIKMTDTIDMVTNSITIEEGKNIVLDLNGHTLTTKKTNGGVIAVAGTLTIQDTSANGDGLIQNNSTSSDRGILVSGGSLIVKSGNIASKTNGIRVESGSLSFEGGSVTATNYGIYVGAGATATISGGKITVTGNNFTDYVVFAPTDASATISGGYFNGKAPGGSGLTGKISGGYFTAQCTFTHIAEGYEIVANDDATYLYKVVSSAA